MASITNEAGGRRTIQFIGADGKRRSVRLGKASQRQAESVRMRIEHLIAARANRTHIDPETAAWLDSIDAQLRDRLARAGLVERAETVRLADLVSRWMERRGKTLRLGTRVRLEQGKRSLLAFFGEDKPIASISEGDAEDYRAALLGEELAEATVRKRCSDARVWFRYALRHGMVRANPFEVVPTAAVATANLTYISEQDAKRVMAEIANPDLRLLFALARWGGMRVVSEPRALTWDCVDWGRKRIIVKSPKTERHPGHEQRTIPLFPELDGPLMEALERAEEGGTQLVLPMLSQKSSAALRDPMFAAIKRAGLKPWPRLWHNLRSSRQTDLEQKFPSHVVCAWLGNSTTIARRHYLQVLDADYTKAIGAGQKSGAESGAVPACPSSQTVAGENGDPAENAPNAELCEATQSCASGISDPDGI